MGPGFESPLAHSNRPQKSSDKIKMMPKYKSKIIQDLDTSILTLPPEEILSSRGLVENRDYYDERGWGWKEFQEVYKIEKQIILEAKKTSNNETEFEIALNEAEEQDILFLPSFETGIDSITTALSALGCTPVSSCRSHPHLDKKTRVPYAAGWATKYEAKKISTSAKNLEIGVRNRCIEGYQGIMVYANDLIALLDFSKKLYDDHNN